MEHFAMEAQAKTMASTKWQMLSWLTRLPWATSFILPPRHNAAHKGADNAIWLFWSMLLHCQC